MLTLIGYMHFMLLVCLLLLFSGLFVVVFFCVVNSHLYCLVGCLSMIVWTHAVLSDIYACVLYFSSCTCSAQLSMFHIERHSKNTLFIIITITIIKERKNSTDLPVYQDKATAITHLRQVFGHTMSPEDRRDFCMPQVDLSIWVILILQ